jgi:hypothetical protein
VHLALALSFWHYRTDDTFIFLQYARHLAGGAGPSFNAGEPVFGFSSPLWFLVLAGLARLGLGSLAAAKLAALAASLGSIAALWLFARQRLDARWTAVATVVWAVNAWLVRWTAAAMETALVLALVLAGLAAWERERREPGRPPWSAVLLGLLVLARPEGALLAGLAVLVRFATGGARGRRQAVVSVAIMAGLVVPWLVYAARTMGSLLPVTGAAKGTVGIALGIDPLVDVARIVATTTVVEATFLAGGLVAALRGGALRASAAHLLPVAWMLALPLFYAATGFDVLSRYALPIVPVVLVYGLVAACWLPAGRAWRLVAACATATGVLLLAVVVGRPDGGRVGPAAVASAPTLVIVFAVALGAGWLLAPRLERRRALAVAIAVLVLNGAVLVRVVQPHTSAFGRGVAGCFQAMGEWFAVHTPPDAEVAIADIGAFGYYSGRRVLDLAGLVSPEMIPLVDRLSIQEIAAGLAFAPLARPDYLIDRHSTPGRLDGAMNGVFEQLPLEPCAIQGLGVRAPETIYYTGYRLHWERYRPPPADGGGVEAR